MKRLITLLAAAAWLFAFVPIVAAGTQGSCLPNDGSTVQLFENAIGDQSDGDDRLWQCGDQNNLGFVSHSLAGNCNIGGVFGSGDWNDCVSSAVPHIPPGVKLCFYKDANYTGPNVQLPNGVRTNFDSIFGHDALTSFRFRSLATNCAAP